MDFFYNPFHTPSDPDHMATFWPEPSSRWLKILVVFTLGALPNCIAEVFSDHLDFAPLVPNQDVDLYVVIVTRSAHIASFS